MRILFVTNYFQPEPNFFMGLPFAEELVRRGHEVEVLTGFPNYPGGKVYDGYHIRALQREFMDGIPVLRVPLYPSHDRSSIRRFATYMTFALSASTIGAVTVKPADVAYIAQGPTSIGLPGIVLRVLRRIPYVYDIKDLWPDGPIATGMFSNPLAVWLAHRWCNLTYKCATKIVASTPGFKQKMVERGVPAEKIEVVYNWCDDTRISASEKDAKLAKELGMEGKFNIVFAGNMGASQALWPVLDAAKIIEADCPNVQFVFIGSGVDVKGLKRKAQEMGLKNVIFHGRRPVSEIGSILILADVLFVHLKDEAIYKITIPSKTQAYMKVGRPILVAVGGDTNDLVEEAGAGLACEPENPQSIAKAVRNFQAMSRSNLDKMGANGKRYYEENLSFLIAVSKYEKIFESAANSFRKKR